MNVHLYPSILKNETRILKITRSLRANAVFEEIAVVGRAASELPSYEDIGDGIHIYRLAPVFGNRIESPLGKFVRTLGWYFAVLLWIHSRSVICLNCHSLPILPLAVLVKTIKRCILVYDTHELETETNGTYGFRKYISKFIEWALISHADAVCVVNRSIAAWYKKSYSLVQIWVVHNLPRRITGVPKRTGLLRKAIGLEQSEAKLFIYQGLLSTGRGIEMLIKAFSDISGDQCHLVCMGYGPMEDFVRKASLMHKNIHFMPAVDPGLVKDFTVDADVGFSLFENTCLSHYLCSPNKLYEYAACGVVPIVSDFPEMSRFIESYDCGWKSSPNAKSLRNLIESIDAESLNIKRINVTKAGLECCWENEEPELLNMYVSLGLHNSLRKVAK
jgi:glycosyltransferase involved in cell wall biosynthesis